MSLHFIYMQNIFTISFVFRLVLTFVFSSDVIYLVFFSLLAASFRVVSIVNATYLNPVCCVRSLFRRLHLISMQKLAKAKATKAKEKRTEKFVFKGVRNVCSRLDYYAVRLVESLKFFARKLLGICVQSNRVIWYEPASKFTWVCP